MSGAGGPRVDKLFEQAKSADSLAESIRLWMAAIIGAIGTVMASGVLTIADIVIKPAQAVADIGALGVQVIFGSPLRVVLAGTNETINALLGPFGLGPFALPFSVVIVLLTFWIVARYLREDETGNIFPTVPVDIAWFGADEEDNEEG